MTRRSRLRAHATLLVFILIISTSLTRASYAAGAEGTLDTSFNSTGYAYYSEGQTGASRLYGVAVDAQGRALVAGAPGKSGDSPFTVMRYNKDGSLDSTFGTNGVSEKLFRPLTGAEVRDIAIDSAGKIIVAGSQLIFPFMEFTLIRYNADGTIDTTFGTSGVASASFPTDGGAALNCIAIDSQGRIVAGGNRYLSGVWNFALSRFNSDGTLDTSFDGDGKLTTDVVPGGISTINSVLIDSFNRIIVSGSAANGVGWLSVIARYTVNGSLDTTFDGDGLFFRDAGNQNYGYILGSTLDKEGKIITVGFASLNSETVLTVMKNNSDSTLDTTFGINGVASFDFSAGQRDIANAVQIDSFGKIIVAGFSDTKSLILRLNPNGSLDTTFGSSGFSVFEPILGKFSLIYDIAIAPSGEIYTAGAGALANTSYVVFLTMRINALARSITATNNSPSADQLAAEQRAKQQREMAQLLAMVTAVASVLPNLSQLTLEAKKSARCIKGKSVRSVPTNGKCPKGFKKVR